MKVTFNKFSVCLMYLAVIGFPVSLVLTSSWPPMEVTICWFAFWIGQAVITATLQISKKKREQKYKLVNEFSRYITEDNVNEIIESKTGLKIKPRKEKKNGKINK